MKKALSLLLAVLMLCSLSVSAFAATVTTSGDMSATLTVQYSESKQKDNYAATITWDAMSFTYSVSDKSWNTETMAWETTGTAVTGWSEAQNVTVANKSSQSILVKIAFTPATDTKGVTGITVGGAEINEQGYTLSAATPGTDGNDGTAAEWKFAIQPTGTLDSSVTTSTEVGTITLTLS